MPVGPLDCAGRSQTELLEDDDLLDAIAAMSDELALGVLRAAARAGRDVRGTVAVTGWDDSEAAPGPG